MKFLLFLFLLFPVFAPAQQPGRGHRNEASPIYFPPAGAWEHRSPSSFGLDSAKLNDAIQFIIGHESKASRNLKTAQLQSFWGEPYILSAGPFADRGDPTGLIIYKGYIVAEWGNPSAVEMTNSVTKSFLSSVVGVAVDRGMIRSVFDTVESYMAPVEPYQPGVPVDDRPLLDPFGTPHNRLLTWDVMLRQTSDWEGTLWGIPDWADRPKGPHAEAMTRPRNAPGAVWTYNDVRVNALALAAMNVWRKPLPEVLKKYIMDPIGASASWRWMGYHDSWIVIDGQPMQSVSGGGHFGGGMFINAYDMARFGLLTLHRGNWQGKELLSDAWVTQALTPTTANPEYGYMNWFLNTGRKMFPAAPATAFAHIGNGTNVIYVDPDHNLVAVIRWIDNRSLAEAVQAILAAFPNN